MKPCRSLPPVIALVAAMSIAEGAHAAAATGAEPIPMPRPTLPGEAPADGAASAAEPSGAGQPSPQDTAKPANGGGLDPERFGGRPVDAAYGAFQRGLYVTAYNLALERARRGDPNAQTLVAEILSRGLGVPLNNAEAAKWYALAAEQGVPEAQFQYALMLLDGRYMRRDVNGAYALLEAAAEAGNVLAQFNLAQLVVQREPGEAGMAKALAYYERAADAGLADAQYAMSQLVANGAGGRQRDEAEARRWLERAAMQGFDTAELDLGTWLVEGRGGAKNAKAGFNWLRRAALSGNVAAQNRVAKLYMQGIGVEPDTGMAAAWYILARRAGLNDPEMDDLLNGLEPEEMKAAIEKANRLR